MTPEQQADYDYAMSQLKSKPFSQEIDFGSMPSINLKIDINAWDQAMQEVQNKINASIYTMMGIPKDIFLGSSYGFLGPNSRCTIIPQGSTTNG